MMILGMSLVLSWFGLFLSSFIKEERTGKRYRFTIKGFVVVGSIESLLILLLWWRGLTGQTLLYVSMIIALFVIQAAIDWKYQEIALEWVGVSLVCNLLLMHHLKLFSFHLLGFTVSVFLLLVIYAMYIGFGLGDVLIISANVLLLTPLRVASDQPLFWYTESYRNILLIFMVAQLLAWGYMAFKKQVKKGAQTAFMPWYAVTFIAWFYVGLF